MMDKSSPMQTRGVIYDAPFFCIHHSFIIKTNIMNTNSNPSSAYRNHFTAAKFFRTIINLFPKKYSKLSVQTVVHDQSYILGLSGFISNSDRLLTVLNFAIVKSAAVHYRIEELRRDVCSVLVGHQIRCQHILTRLYDGTPETALPSDCDAATTSEISKTVLDIADTFFDVLVEHHLADQPGSSIARGDLDKRVVQLVTWAQTAQGLLTSVSSSR